MTCNMANLTKAEPKSALIEAGTFLLECKQQKAELEEREKSLRDYILKSMKKNRLRSLTLEDGTIFTIKAGNRSVYITDREKAEAYLDNYNCWKLDNAKLLGIFGRELK